MTTTTVTTREMLNAVIDIMNGIEPTNGASRTAIVAKANEMLARLDRERKPTKAELEKQRFNASLKERIVEILKSGNRALLTTEIAFELSTTDCPITFSKVSPLCRQLRDENIIIEIETKVKGKGTQKAYKIADCEGE